uniref:General transcription factor 3C polypeptide 3 n=1 Tax=Rhabditophanes sp. KR3021 TaxID=114890 RepID=A0AC35UHY3_9BILA
MPTSSLSESVASTSEKTPRRKSLRRPTKLIDTNPFSDLDDNVPANQTEMDRIAADIIGTSKTKEDRELDDSSSSTISIESSVSEYEPSDNELSRFRKSLRSTTRRGNKHRSGYMTEYGATTVEKAINPDGQLLINEETGEFFKLESSENEADEDSDTNRPVKKKRTVRPKAPTALDGLIGQANMMTARENYDDALRVLLAAIKENPRNPDVYRAIANIYAAERNPERELEYLLLAGYVQSKTTYEDWIELAEKSSNIDRFDSSAACYSKAILLKPKRWINYQKRLHLLDMLGSIKPAMLTRLRAIQNCDVETMGEDNVVIMDELISTVSDYYVKSNDVEKAISALEAYVCRYKEMGRNMQNQLNVLLSMWYEHSKYPELVKAIVVLADGISENVQNDKPILKKTLLGAIYTILPFPPNNVEFTMTDEFPTLYYLYLMISLSAIGCETNYVTMFDNLLKRQIEEENMRYYIDFINMMMDRRKGHSVLCFLSKMLEFPEFANSPETYFRYGLCYEAVQSNDEAQRMYNKALELDFNHVDVRITLSNLLVTMNQPEAALKCLQPADLHGVTRLPNERLLIKRAEMVYRMNDIKNYYETVKLLLAPYFYECHNKKYLKNFGRRSARNRMTLVLKHECYASIQGSEIKKFVSKVGVYAERKQIKFNVLDGSRFHDFCFRLFEIAEEKGDYDTMCNVACYANLVTLILDVKLNLFYDLLYYAAVKAKKWQLAFEWLRSFYTDTQISDLSAIKIQSLNNKVLTSMNYVFCHYQNVNNQRYVQRAQAKAPENVHFRIVNANFSLFTGSYRHALIQYVKAWRHYPNSAMLNLQIGLIFAHLSSKKDVISKHLVANRAVFYFKRYSEIRYCNQEVFYNTGRLFHQLNLLPKAIYYYEKVLYDIGCEDPTVLRPDEFGNMVAECPPEYSFKKRAAYNLALIYRNNQNFSKARQLYEKFISI